MRKIHTRQTGVIGLSIALALGVTIGAAWLLMAAGQLRSSGSDVTHPGSVSLQAGLSPLPTPTAADPDAGWTPPWPVSEGWHVTPSPQHGIQMQAPQRADAPATPAARYAVTLGEDKSQQLKWIDILDKETGASRQIGTIHATESHPDTDSFDTPTDKINLLSANDDYAAWAHYCRPCANAAGLYVTDLRDPSPRWITDKYSPGFAPQFVGDWMVYAYHPEDWKGPLDRVVPYSQIWALNLVTGESIEVAPHAYIHLKDQYAVGSGWVVWRSREDSEHSTLEALHLDKQDRFALELPFELGNPISFQITEGLLIWFDAYWHGYDLANKTYFSIDAIPDNTIGVEDMTDFTYDGKALHWGVLTTGGEWQYYAAELRPNPAADTVRADTAP